MVVSFDDQVRVLTEFTSDRYRLRDAIRKLNQCLRQSPFGHVLSTVSVPVSVPHRTARGRCGESFMRQMGRGVFGFGRNVVDDLDGVGDAFENGANALQGSQRLTLTPTASALPVARNFSTTRGRRSSLSQRSSQV